MHWYKGRHDASWDNHCVIIFYILLRAVAKFQFFGEVSKNIETLLIQRVIFEMAHCLFTKIQDCNSHERTARKCGANVFIFKGLVEVA